MLELKRKVNQAVLVGKGLSVTVHQIKNNNAHLVMRSPGLEFEVVLYPRHSWTAVVDGRLLTVELDRVERGEAVLGFDADRALRIDREEVST